MFLGKAIYETLHENGDLHSYILTPARQGSHLIVDELADIEHRAFKSNAVDVGPLRMYAEKSGVQFQFVRARLAGRTFQAYDDRIILDLRHKDFPLMPNHAGYYALLLPRNYSGDMDLSVEVAGNNQSSNAKKVFLTDTHQQLISSGFYVYADQSEKPQIHVHAEISKSASPPLRLEHSTFVECFGGYIDGLHDSSVANLIREINKNLTLSSSQVFICHSSADKAAARRVANALAGRGIRVWIDEAEIRVGDSLIGKIEDGIISSKNLIIILTPNSVDSRWCKEELRMALAMQIGNENIRVLPALFSDCELPGFLREKAYADFRDPARFHEEIENLEAAIG